MNKILIIPDIHGRKFWKEDEVQVAWDNSDHVVFLGDYLDPYPREGIAWSEAWDNFMEIIEAKEKEPEKVTLLLGNHDYHYMFSEILGFKGSRFNYEAARETTEFFLKRLDLFQLAWSITNARDITFLFTHAGIVKSWLTSNKLVPPATKKVAAWLNKFLSSDIKRLMTLWDVSQERGGWSISGSPIWADKQEHQWNDWRKGKVYQIFGHTQGCTNWMASDNYICLDCRRPFILLPGCGVLGEIPTKEGTRYWTKVIETYGLPMEEWVKAWIYEV